MSEPKYSDGRYHVENGEDGRWYIVNIHGEKCTFNGERISFPTKHLAEKYCKNLNSFLSGGVETNFFPN